MTPGGKLQMSAEAVTIQLTLFPLLYRSNSSGFCKSVFSIQATWSMSNKLKEKTGSINMSYQPDTSCTVWSNGKT